MPEPDLVAEYVALYRLRAQTANEEGIAWEKAYEQSLDLEKRMTPAQRKQTDEEIEKEIFGS